MARPGKLSRRIALFVEGETERALPAFFHKWLDPQLQGKVGIHAVKSQGVSEYLDDLPKKVELYLNDRRANFVFGLVDLYGLPASHGMDLSNCATVADKVKKARQQIRSLVPDKFRNRFRQHFAVHEVEAWLLAYPKKWPPNVRQQIARQKPEEVNFDEPPAKFLKKLLGGSYKKTVLAKNIFPHVDPQQAIDKCPFLKLLADDLLHCAKRLQ